MLTVPNYGTQKTTKSLNKTRTLDKMNQNGLQIRKSSGRIIEKGVGPRLGMRSFWIWGKDSEGEDGCWADMKTWAGERSRVWAGIGNPSAEGKRLPYPGSSRNSQQHNQKRSPRFSERHCLKGIVRGSRTPDVLLCPPQEYLLATHSSTTHSRTTHTHAPHTLMQPTHSCTTHTHATHILVHHTHSCTTHTYAPHTLVPHTFMHYTLMPSHTHRPHTLMHHTHLCTSTLIHHTHQKIEFVASFLFLRFFVFQTGMWYVALAGLELAK